MADEFKIKMPTREEIESRQFEEYIYELVASEIQSGVLRSGLWTKAVLESGGDEKAAKCLYIKYRAQVMVDDAFIAEEEKKKMEEEERNRQKRIEPAISELFYAAEYGHSDAIDNILRIGVSVNVQRSDGITPLYLAASNGHEDTVKILISKGANPRILSRSGKTPADAARIAGHGNIANYLDSIVI